MLDIDRLHEVHIGRRSGKTTRLLCDAINDLLVRPDEEFIVLVLAWNNNHTTTLATQLIDLAGDMEVCIDKVERKNGVCIHLHGVRGMIQVKYIGDRYSVDQNMRGYNYVTYDDRD